MNLPYFNEALKKIFQIMWKNWGDPSQKNPPKQTNVGHEPDEAIGEAMVWRPQADSPSRGAITLAKVIKPDS